MNRFCIALLAFLTLTAIAVGQYDIAWHTIDGGGACPPAPSTGGPYELSGSIGQPDAGSAAQPLIGGTFELVGGFWHATPAANCACPGDMNIDGLRDGRDIQNFAACLIAGGNCACADVDAVPGLSFDDVTVFVANLLGDVPCP